MDIVDQLGEVLVMAPYLIIIGFVGTFTFTFVMYKLAQSDSVYEWFEGKMDVWRVKQARIIRAEMAKDVKEFLGKKEEHELSPREQKIYYRMLESYYNRIDKLYGQPKTTKTTRRKK